MVGSLNARPTLLKQANLSLIRRVLKAKGTATRAEIAAETKISSTTVRTLLAEMVEDSELESLGQDESSGGRRAERYRLRPDRYHGAAFCITGDQVHALLVNLCGEIVETSVLKPQKDAIEPAVCAHLDRLLRRYEIKSIGLGVPGIVEGGSYWRKSEAGDDLKEITLGGTLAQKYGIPVLLENDLKATAIGFGRCYEKEFPGEEAEKINMAYIYFEESFCVSAGFIVGGQVLRGGSNFAGELGLIPVDGEKLLDDCMAEPMDDRKYTQLIVRVLSWVCGILNPQYIALGGPGLRTSCLGPISDGLFSLLPKHMFAEILHAPDLWHDYQEGMAYLTAAKIFDDVRLITG